MRQVLLICAGGAVGSGCRYALTGSIMAALGPAAGFPVGTLAANCLGSFALAIILELGTDPTRLAPTTRLALGTGVMGGFTTYSAFSLETLALLDSPDWPQAWLYVAATLIGGLVACGLGFFVAQRWMRRRQAVSAPPA